MKLWECSKRKESGVRSQESERRKKKEEKSREEKYSFATDN
jgi:hypothetical protein